MRVSANLGFLYTDLPLPERIATAAADGFDAVEFHWPYDIDPTTVRAALSAAEIPGLVLNTSPGNLAAGDFGLSALPNREDEAQSAIRQALDYAATAGIGSVHLMAGRASGPAAEASFLRNLAYACKHAEDSQIGILLEPLNTRDVPGYFLSGTGHARDLIAQIGSSRPRIMYDFYHMQIMQGDHVATIEELGELNGHYQIASVPDRVEPDAGELDFKWLLERLGIGRVGAEYRPRMAPGQWLARFRGAIGAG